MVTNRDLIGSFYVDEITAAEMFRGSYCCFKSGAMQGRIDQARGQEAVLDRKFRQIIHDTLINGGEVWDIGGAAGVDYFKSGSNKIENVKWVVFELDEIYKEYAEAMKDYPGLEFRSINACTSQQPMGKPSMLNIVDALQYMGTPLTFLRSVSANFDYVALTISKCANKSFVTVQGGISAAWVLSIEDVQKALAGFEMIYIDQTGECGFTGNCMHREIQLQPYSHMAFKRKRS